MLTRGVRWNASKTREIYHANETSERLIAYLESSLFDHGIVNESADSPNVERGYGRMVYYFDNRRVITAAPRKIKEHIHVVLSQEEDMSEYEKATIPLGNQGNDLVISTEEQVDALIQVLKERGNRHQSGDSQAPVTNRSLEDWLNLLLNDEVAMERERIITKAREEFLANFTELDSLRLGKIDLLEFKKRLDQKAKVKINFQGEKINIWGFSGFSGQMFFNQLYNIAEYLDEVEEFTNVFLQSIEIPKHEDEDMTWTREKYEYFCTFISEMKKRVIAKGYPAQKCPSNKFSTFFLSFFWGMQDLRSYPIFYKASRDGLHYLGYPIDDEQGDESSRYLHFVTTLQTLKRELSQYTIDEVTMKFLGHFLYYVVRVSEQEETVSGLTDPMLQDAFAVKIRDAFYDHGYKIASMQTTDWESANLDEEKMDLLMWQYNGTDSEGEMVTYLIIWEDEESYNADVYLENVDGEFIKGTTILAEEEEDFLKSLHTYLKKTSDFKKPYTIEDAVKETYLPKVRLEEWLELLSEKRQIILYGPPGTGKTYVAQRLAKILTQQSKQTHLIQFHPSYTYEEFIEGIRPELVDVNNTQQISVKVKPGIFAELCNEARKPENQEKSFVLIIDEFNRANTAKVFGELLYALEYRNTPIQLPYSKTKLVVPENFYIIGTMNTTDRSLAQLDFALRRRFQFIPFSTMETENVLKAWLQQHQPSMLWVSELIRKVNELIDDPDISIGHSYFIGQTLSEDKLQRIWKYQIMPYLEECFVYDREKLAQFELETLRDVVEDAPDDEY
ncbi:McrB family protein [Evansella tamaricis]|uniref:AAA family ATPase n=1 Tax=Evansella tamaricis TaxID=2069301 RepID=A0ABS6JHS2_9BACI|nr:AAA family ATPase [Evansella tamaricis]MBU9713224.1 AAA family ATPase [Evansella tamaricis]